MPDAPFDRRFAWKATAANGWIITGLFLDGWYHINRPEAESFFTPWHGILYSGVLVAMAVLGEHGLRARRRGAPLRAALPPGYGVVLLGGAVFLAGGLSDMAWHLTLGIEVGVEALLSPPHLVLALAGFLVFTGPLRHAWHGLGRHARPADLLPALVATGFALALLGFFTQYLHPFTHLYPTLSAAGGAGQDLLHAAGIAGIILYGATVAGAVLLLALRWRLPFGAATVVLGVSGGLMTTQRGTYALLPALLGAGLAVDGLLAWRPPGRDDVAATRLTAAGAPGLTVAAYLAALELVHGLTWSVHLVTGAVVVAAAAGSLVGLLLAPPAAVTDHADPLPEPHPDLLRDAQVVRD
jgi:hypothetical protein